MNKRFWISVAVMFVLFLAFGFLVHGLLLAGDYTAAATLFRSPEDQMGYFPYMLIAHLFAAFAFVWIYVRMKEDKPFLAQGACYGLVIASLTIIPKFLIYYAVQPLPGITVVKQIVFDTIATVVLGIVVALLNK